MWGSGCGELFVIAIMVVIITKIIIIIILVTAITTTTTIATITSIVIILLFSFNLYHVCICVDFLACMYMWMSVQLERLVAVVAPVPR